VLDVRNQGLSQKVEYGNKISRFATDLKEFGDSLQVQWECLQELHPSMCVCTGRERKTKSITRDLWRDSETETRKL
jgi:hypothetical protein